VTRKLHIYSGQSVTVTFDATLCIHNGHCVRSLPAVFNTAARPWVQPDHATDIRSLLDVVAGCPSGALRATTLDGSSADDGVSQSPVHLQVSRHGPILIRGPVELVDADGSVLGSAQRVAICRCGRSAHKPYCDNSHRSAGWRDDP
jgi:uncharacterized Fe-S cluster protein YjdI